MAASIKSEKDLPVDTGAVQPVRDIEGSTNFGDDDGEVFKTNVDGENYRTVGW